MATDYNPHGSIGPVAAGSRNMKCDYCGDTGSLEELQGRQCPHVYPACETCGGTPECTPDCAAMLGLLYPT